MKTLILLAALLLASPAFAQSMDRTMHHAKGNDVSAKASTAKFEKAMEVMHKDMMITYTGDTDADFVRGMIPHHQGAIDMAKVQLQYGKDPELRKLSREIIKAQEEEIKEMKRWLRNHDGE